MLLIYAARLMAALALSVYTASLWRLQTSGRYDDLAGIAASSFRSAWPLTRTFYFERVKKNCATTHDGRGAFRRVQTRLELDPRLEHLLALTCAILIGSALHRARLCHNACNRILLSMFTAIIVTRNFIRSAIGERISPTCGSSARTLSEKRGK